MHPAPPARQVLNVNTVDMSGTFVLDFGDGEEYECVVLPLPRHTPFHSHIHSCSPSPQLACRRPLGCLHLV